MIRILISGFIFWASLPVIAQRQITGRILDSQSQKPLRDVKIELLNKSETLTNALGFFQLSLEENDSIIRVNAEGYIGDVFRIPATNNFQIKLNKVNQEIAVEQTAEFPGGMSEFYRYVISTVNFPREARESKVSGKVLASFLVDKDGSIPRDSIKIIQGLHPSCDREVIRVLQKSPKWKPGSIRGEPTRQRIVIPVDFSVR